jgi:hypothetical protein
LSEFLPVKDPAEARKLLKEAVRTLAPATIWTKEQKSVLTSSIRQIDESGKLIYAWVPTGTNPADFVAELNVLGSHDCFFSIALPRANVLFRATCIGYDSGGFRFKAPEKIFKVQRRRDARVLIPFGHVIRIDMPDPLFPEQRLSKKIFDISASGMSFIVTAEEAAAFQTGGKIMDAFFSIRSRKIRIDAEVRHLRPQPEGSTETGVKVGIQFKRIDSGDSGWIAAYVFEQSRNTMMRIL